MGDAAWCLARAARGRPYGLPEAPVEHPAALLEAELARLRRLPEWLWFSPRFDPFAATVEPARRTELLGLMRWLLGRGVDLALVTRGGLRDARELVSLARSARGRLGVRVGVFSRDPAVASRWEAGLAPFGQRVSLASELAAAGADVSLELGPIVPFVNDGERQIAEALRSAARAGVKSVVPRWIEDGPGLVGQVEREISRSAGRMLMGWFRQPGARRSDGTASIALQVRSPRRQRIHDVARDLGMTVIECRCVHAGAAVACMTAPAGGERDQLDLFGT